MPALSASEDYQNIFHWAETQKDGTVPAFGVRKNDPYEVFDISLARWEVLCG